MTSFKIGDIVELDLTAPEWGQTTRDFYKYKLFKITNISTDGYHTIIGINNNYQFAFPARWIKLIKSNGEYNPLLMKVDQMWKRQNYVKNNYKVNNHG